MAERPELPFEPVPDRVTVYGVFTPRPSANPPSDELGDGWTDVPSLQAGLADSDDEPPVEAASRLIDDLTERAQGDGHHVFVRHPDDPPVAFRASAAEIAALAERQAEYRRVAGPVYGDGPGTPMFWVEHSPDNTSWTDVTP